MRQYDFSPHAVGWTSKVRRAMGLSCRHRRFDQEQYQHRLGFPCLGRWWFCFELSPDWLYWRQRGLFSTIFTIRNTEIIMATIGLLYSFIFIISGRLQYFGLTIFSFFGRTSSYVQKIPYDHVMREEVGLRRSPRIYIPQRPFCCVDRDSLPVSPLFLPYGPRLACGPRLGDAVRTDPLAAPFR